MSKLKKSTLLDSSATTWWFWKIDDKNYLKEKQKFVSEREEQWKRELDRNFFPSLCVDVACLARVHGQCVLERGK